MVVQFLIHKGVLHQCLTVVKHAIYLNGRDVLAQGSELTFLNRTHLSFGVEHIYMYALNAEEAISHGRTCVATGSNEHVDLSRTSITSGTSITRATSKISQQARHEPSTHILEGEGWSVEQLQGIDTIRYLHHWAVERQCIIHQFLQGV